VLCFAGGSSSVEASTYIQVQFESLNERQHEKDIYTHVLCATDSTDMKRVMDSVLDVTIQNNLNKTCVL
jgi:guanine nucleotide-binding protein G(i) subunit alpha